MKFPAVTSEVSLTLASSTFHLNKDFIAAPNTYIYAEDCIVQGTVKTKALHLHCGTLVAVPQPAERKNPASKRQLFETFGEADGQCEKQPLIRQRMTQRSMLRVRMDCPQPNPAVSTKLFENTKIDHSKQMRRRTVKRVTTFLSLLHSSRRPIPSLFSPLGATERRVQLIP